MIGIGCRDRFLFSGASPRSVVPERRAGCAARVSVPPTQLPTIPNGSHSSCTPARAPLLLRRRACLRSGARSRLAFAPPRAVPRAVLLLPAGRTAGAVRAAAERRWRYTAEPGSRRARRPHAAQSEADASGDGNAVGHIPREHEADLRGPRRDSHADRDHRHPLRRHGARRPGRPAGASACARGWWRGQRRGRRWRRHLLAERIRARRVGLRRDAAQLDGSAAALRRPSDAHPRDGQHLDARTRRHLRHLRQPAIHPAANVAGLRPLPRLDRARGAGEPRLAARRRGRLAPLAAGRVRPGRLALLRHVQGASRLLRGAAPPRQARGGPAADAGPPLLRTARPAGHARGYPQLRRGGAAPLGVASDSAAGGPPRRLGAAARRHRHAAPGCGAARRACRERAADLRSDARLRGALGILRATRANQPERGDGRARHRRRRRDRLVRDAGFSVQRRTPGVRVGGRAFFGRRLHGRDGACAHEKREPKRDGDVSRERMPQSAGSSRERPGAGRQGAQRRESET